MPTNECIPVFEPGGELTGRCTAAVRGKRFVISSADITGGIFGTENIRIAECGAGGEAIGVARYDGAIAEEIPFINIPGLVVPMPAGVALTAGQAVQSDAQGRPIVLAAGRKLGVAVSTQGVVDSDVAIKLTLS